MKCGVQRIVTQAGRASALVLDDGTEITADHVISSVGAPETERLLSAGADANPPAIPPGRHSFVETITILNRQPAALGWGDDTIIFFNDSPRFDYACPRDWVDLRSGVICIPNNFDFGAGRELPEGVWRVTCLANPQPWFAADEPAYAAAKRHWFGEMQRGARRFLPAVADETLAATTIATDMFTPRTIAKYTGHLNGTIYGAPQKVRDGRTSLANLYLCGTDQGFLGIVGAMLSGISMANYHILAKS
jgi:phytoene dehydrogenase-like protein